MEYNKVWDFFEEIYCINLDHRTDRWEHAQKEFENVGVLEKVQRYSGIKNNDGRLGLIKTVLDIIKQSKERELNNVLIFEDDVHFLNNTIEVLKKSLFQIGTLDWWLLYLGANTHEPLQLFSKARPNILILKNGFATHALCYNKKTFDFFIRKYDNLNYVEYGDILDVFMANYFQRKNMCLVVNPIIATQYDSFSDIENHDVKYGFIEDRFKTNTSHLKTE